MPADKRDPEIVALETVIRVLGPLDEGARSRVLDYAMQRLGMRELPPLEVTATAGEPEKVSHQSGPRTVVDIRSLRLEKAPATANEMAAVAAYYLAELAPDRKETVTTSEVETLFKQAGHPLPSRINMTLPNAAAAGYFDRAAAGTYKLNPVGFNLVTQSLPRGSSSAGKKATSRQTTARKASSVRKTSSSRKAASTQRQSKKK